MNATTPFQDLRSSGRPGPVLVGAGATRFAFAVVCVAFFSQPAVAETKPSNVLMIAIDDLKTIGTLYAEEPGSFLKHVYPDPKLRGDVANRMTPNIRRLADRGVRFMDAYCAAPACNPSRAALMTGIHPRESGLTTNAGGIFFRDYKYEGERPLQDATTLPELLKANGWYTASTGKIFHTARSFKNADGNRSWTDWTSVNGGAGSKTRGEYSPKSLDWGQEGDGDATFHLLNDYRRCDWVGELFETGRATGEQGEFELPSDKPFFFACGIFRPHLPFYATADLLALFPSDEMTVTRELLDYFTKDAGDLPDEAYRLSGLAVDSKGLPTIGKDRFVDILNHGNKVGGEDGDLMGWKRMLQHYFASCAIADRCVGRLLDGLDASPHAKNTMVILWSDHGYHLGEKLHETKFTLWDDGANVNFIVSDPRFPSSAGKRCDHPVTLTDIYPTVVAMAGLDLPSDRIRGADLGPLLADPGAGAMTAARSTYKSVKHNMLRTARYKVIRYDDDPKQVELYDMRADPEEYNNLADRPEHASTKAKLLEQLDSVGSN